MTSSHLGMKPDVIFIPQEIRGRSLSALRVSTRLRLFFESKQFRLVADLHGRTFDEFHRQPNLGARTIDELRELIRTIQRQHRLEARELETTVQISPTGPNAPAWNYRMAATHRLGWEPGFWLQEAEGCSFCGWMFLARVPYSLQDAKEQSRLLVSQD